MSEGKCIRFSRSGVVDWQLKKKYFAIKSARLKALKKWETSRYYPPKDVQDRINRLLMTNSNSNYIHESNCNGGEDREQKKNQDVHESRSEEAEDLERGCTDDFTKGLIIGMRIKSPSDKLLDERMLRKVVRAIGDSNEIPIAYIDLKDTSETTFKEDGSTERSCFLRLNCPEDSKKLVEKLSMNEFQVTSTIILEGEEEAKYWNRMKECQENQKSKKRRK